MRISQFWRLLHFMRFLIMRFYCQNSTASILIVTAKMHIICFQRIGFFYDNSFLRTFGSALLLVLTTVQIKIFCVQNLCAI